MIKVLIIYDNPVETMKGVLICKYIHKFNLIFKSIYEIFNMIKNVRWGVYKHDKDKCL